ncbi:ribonuclease HIII [Streptococcus parauberis]|uniref:ribonuclease HIII n=1 Tax=Streptococcus parauberis TaxID=1348 RepID=UPI000C1463ED|nr:ribonuclease HIII [Streptococcus parauberis]
METIVMKMDGSQKTKLLNRLNAYQTSNNNPYVAFSAKYKGVTILLYTSGKLVFQGSAAPAVASEFGYQAPDSSSSRIDSSKNQNLALIGSDEVGNGSYFGGIAVVASLVTPEDHTYLKELGVDDSKNLTDPKIRHIAPLLEARIPHKALLLSPKKYNQMVGPDKPYNAVSVKVALHNQAIFLLLQEGVKADKIVIDAFTSQANYQKHLKREKNQFTNVLTFQEKAESDFLAVAVSSIIARNLFLENLKELGAELGYQLPSGAGKQSDQVAAKLLEAYGMPALEFSAKLHFANTKKGLSLAKKLP